MKAALIILSVFHGLIHLMGFVKAFELAEIKALTLPISKPFGILWLSTFLLFIVTSYLFFHKNNHWWIVGSIAIFISQLLVFYFWADAKFGTIANLIILFAIVIDYSSWNFENDYKIDVAKAMSHLGNIQTEIISENDLTHLPNPVQKYLRYVGVVGQPKIKNVKISFTGEMREKGKEYFPFKSEQYNFFEKPTRLFFMQAKVKGLPTNGYHAYKNNRAGMSVRLLSLIPVATLEAQAGEEGFKTETVTFFNDMCLFAPAALIDKSIKWEEIDEHSARALFSNKGVTISTILYFNPKGQLINFISDDRCAITPDGLKNYRFSTPASNYKNINGYNLCMYGEAIWHYPDEEFVYGKFRVADIAYNIKD